jgi:hypothetical protein
VRVDGQIELKMDLTPKAVISNVTTASVIPLGFDLTPSVRPKTGRFKLENPP